MAVSCGSLHTAAVTERGTLFAWGCGEDGQLGLGEGEDVHEPTSVDVLTGCRVVYIAAGRQHSGAVGDDNTSHTGF